MWTNTNRPVMNDGVCIINNTHQPMHHGWWFMKHFSQLFGCSGITYNEGRQNGTIWNGFLPCSVKWHLSCWDLPVPWSRSALPLTFCPVGPCASDLRGARSVWPMVCTPAAYPRGSCLLYRTHLVQLPSMVSAFSQSCPVICAASFSGSCSNFLLCCGELQDLYILSRTGEHLMVVKLLAGFE